jgi:hypothetical protein
VYKRQQLGFGICSDGDTPAELKALSPTADADRCNATDANPNYLISTSELKGSFAGKDEFGPVLANPASYQSQALWVARSANSNSIYVCYIPKAGSNRSDTTKLRCLNTNGVVSKVAEGACTATVTDWAIPVTDGTQAMYKCVPE